MEQALNKFEKIKEQGQKLSKEVRQKTLGFIITAFGLVAGLAWNQAIQDMIKQLFPLNKNSVIAEFIYAAVMTVFLVVITIFLSRLFDKDGGNK